MAFLLVLERLSPVERAVFLIAGHNRVGRLLAGVIDQIRQAGILIRPTEINGQPGAMFVDPADRLVNVFMLDIADGRIQTIRSVINPHKLRHLGPLANLEDLHRRRRG